MQNWVFFPVCWPILLWNAGSCKFILAIRNGDIVPSQATRPNHTSVQRLLLRTSRDQAFMAKLFTIPVTPNPSRRNKRDRTSDPRYVEGQRLLVEAMKYLAKADPVGNREAVELLSEHVRTRFRMTDSPLS